VLTVSALYRNTSSVSAKHSSVAGAMIFELNQSQSQIICGSQISLAWWCQVVNGWRCSPMLRLSVGESHVVHHWWQRQGQNSQRSWCRWQVSYVATYLFIYSAL